MNTSRAPRPELLWLLAAGALLLALLAWSSWFVVSRHQQAAAQLAAIDPRYARLTGLIQHKDEFAQMSQAVQANLQQFVYPAGQDAGQVGNNALQRVRELATARDLRISSSQAAAPRDEHGFDRIGLVLRIEGQWPQLVGFLRELVQQRPAIYTTNMQLAVQFGGMPGTSPVVLAQLDLYVLQERRP
ncbi:MAG: hypothetical protein H6927_06370 [Burkholderiaceae bacterium]|jgi:general secretion pathway protein M|nr:hypothetical protein [Pseudomonadota bacterium]MCO5117303.1 type II secretion system protein GspM [Burkholderiaceae bacterium]MCP5217724.1 hypothetical protein [Burkholderiaceae bacterium]